MASKRTVLPAIVLAACMTAGAIAQEGHETGNDVQPHPVLSQDSSWAGVMIIVIAGCFFLPAAVIGPIVRALALQDVPPPSSHDEPPGTSGHHGKSGTVEEH